MSKSISQILESLAHEAPISGNHLAQARVLLAAKMYAQQPAQPDCRTCRFHHELGCHQYMSNMRDTAKHCVNGDQHIEAPRVVLWRTE